ncbi:hypothetical protein IFM89_028398 [Coptis chinensis]|uniref:Protein kinase domain-containing protein n=1 Tax=Coptis chinensis TaxID=261450 RepID=A0A835LJQ3_9MAGN|nr:hypothetical protein IFM89_028398 [Coptis chinensis]
MGICLGKHSKKHENSAAFNDVEPTVNCNTSEASEFPFYSPGPLPSFYKNSPVHSTSSTPLRAVKRPFPPPSPAKHIKAFLAGRQRSVKPNEASITEGDESEVELNKEFGFSKQLFAKYELGEEVGSGHFGYTCSARVKKGRLKGQEVAVKVILKSKVYDNSHCYRGCKKRSKNIAGSDRTKNLVQFYGAYEDEENVYIVMELCRGGELLDRILSRGGKYSEKEAKAVMVQILSVAAFFHLQGVVHRDLKPENFLFSTNDEESSLKAIDFGLSDYVRPDERLNDITGSAYYVAPEVLAQAEPSFEEDPWPSLSYDARDFVRSLLNKDYRKRLTASQALSHPWLSSYQGVKIPLDILTLKLVKAYICTSPLRKSALVALAKTLTASQLAYFQKQFTILGPNRSGFISMKKFKLALTKTATNAMKDSRVLDYVERMTSLQYRKLDFEEFCAASISVHQMEAMESWEQHAHGAYELFENEGNKPIFIEELASELGLSVPLLEVHNDWIRQSDGKLSFLGFVRLLHGASSRPLPKVLR